MRERERERERERGREREVSGVYFLKYAASLNHGYSFSAKSQPYGSRLVPATKNVFIWRSSPNFIIIIPPLLNLVAVTR